MQAGTVAKAEVEMWGRSRRMEEQAWSRGLHGDDTSQKVQKARLNLGCQQEEVRRPLQALGQVRSEKRGPVHPASETAVIAA